MFCHFGRLFRKLFIKVNSKNQNHERFWQNGKDMGSDHVQMIIN